MDQSECAHNTVEVTEDAEMVRKGYIANGRKHYSTAASVKASAATFYCAECRAYLSGKVEDLPEWCQRAYRLVFPDGGL